MAATLSFFQIERSFIHFSKKHLTFSDTRVYMAFCRFSFDRYGKNFIVSVGYDALAKEAAVDPRSTKRSCKKMQKLGLLEKVGHSKAGCVMWKLVWQSPDGAEAVRAATMEAALKEGGGGSPTPAKPAVAEHPPSESHLRHPSKNTIRRGRTSYIYLYLPGWEAGSGSETGRAGARSQQKPADDTAGEGNVRRQVVGRRDTRESSTRSRTT